MKAPVYLLILLILCIVSASAADSKKATPLALVPRPTRVFKTADRSHEDTDSWIFSLMIQTGKPDRIAPTAMKAALLRHSRVVSTTAYNKEGLDPLVYQPSQPPRLADGSVSPTPIFWPVAIRIRHTGPAKLAADAMRIEVDATSDTGEVRHGAVDTDGNLPTKDCPDLPVPREGHHFAGRRDQRRPPQSQRPIRLRPVWTR